MKPIFFFFLLALVLISISPILTDGATVRPIIRIDDPNPRNFHPVWNGEKIGGYDVTCYETNTPCTACDALQVIINLTNFGSVIIFPIVTVIAMYGSMQMLLSAGSEEHFRNGKKILISGVVGLTIILCAWLAINTIIHLIAGSPFDWSSISC